MVLPFGVGVGDFIAVAKLIYQITAELKHNPESAADYQDLVIELEALDRALKQLQAIKSTQHDVNRLEAIRALAVTCRSPLETFLRKISKFEKSLGPWKSHHSHIRGLSRRVQWSTMYKDDIAALRAKLAPKSATITILLLTQATDSLAKAQSDQAHIAREVADKLFGQKMLIADSTDKMASLSIGQQDIKAGQAQIGLQLRDHQHEILTLKLKADESLRHSERQERLLNRQDNVLELIRADASVLKTQTCAMLTVNVESQQDLRVIRSSTQTILGRTLDIMMLVTAGVTKINHILGFVSKLRDVMSSLTLEMRQTVFRLLQEFYEIQRRLSVIERLLPKQIDLPFIKFRDALNEVRVFPYDLSRSWSTFQILVTAAFTNRQGLHRVNMGQYFITHARLRGRLKPAFWTNAIRPGDELAMTMILDDVDSEENICPFPACGFSTLGVETTNEGKRCPNCHRLSFVSQGAGVSSSLNTRPPLLLEEASQLSVEPLRLGERQTRSSDPEALISASNAPTASHSTTEDIELYYSVQVNSVFDISGEHWAKEVLERGELEIRGTEGDAENVDPRYRRQRDPAAFFVVGKVFAVLWHENVGRSNRQPGPDVGFHAVGRYGEKIFSHIWRMIVVRRRYGYCWCVAINTYGGKGVEGISRAQDDASHAIVYDSFKELCHVEGQRKIANEPIAVDMTPPNTLDKASRINYAKVFTVEHNVKVLDVGMVAKESMPYLEARWVNGCYKK